MKILYFLYKYAKLVDSSLESSRIFTALLREPSFITLKDFEEDLTLLVESGMIAEKIYSFERIGNPPLVMYHLTKKGADQVSESNSSLKSGEDYKIWNVFKKMEWGPEWQKTIEQ